MSKDKIVLLAFVCCNYHPKLQISQFIRKKIIFITVHELKNGNTVEKGKSSTSILLIFWSRMKFSLTGTLKRLFRIQES